MSMDTFEIPNDIADIFIAVMNIGEGSVVDLPDGRTNGARYIEVGGKRVTAYTYTEDEKSLLRGAFRAASWELSFPLSQPPPGSPRSSGKTHVYRSGLGKLDGSIEDYYRDFILLKMTVGGYSDS